MSEFSRVISIKQSLMNDGGRIQIVATSEECSALAERFEFDSLECLSLQGQINHHEQVKGAYVFTGIVVGSLKYAAEDEFSSVSEVVDLHLLWRAPEDESAIDYELIQDGAVDFGELAAQFFYLAQDTFMEDALMASAQIGSIKAVHDDELAEKDNPFSVLQNLFVNKKDQF